MLTFFCQNIGYCVREDSLRLRVSGRGTKYSSSLSFIISVFQYHKSSHFARVISANTKQQREDD